MTTPFRATADNNKIISVPALGLDLTILLPTGVLDGATTVFETVNAAGFGPPLHRHREAEIFRVLQGAYLYEVDGRRRGLRSGGRRPRIPQCVGPAVEAVGRHAAGNGCGTVFSRAG
jgi:hypothetical protein